MGKLRRFEVRTNCEYVILVEATTPDEAEKKAFEVDLKDWEQAWAPAEVEEYDDEDE